MGLMFIKNFPDRMFAERAQQTLEQEGIFAVIQSIDTGILGAGASAGLPQGADLYVDDADSERARDILSVVFDGI